MYIGKRVACGMTLALLWAFQLQAKEATANVNFWTLPALQASSPIPGSNRVPGDFNGDGVSDLLWFNPVSSSMAFWLMDTDATGAVRRIGSKTFNITPGYAVAAVGDFNGDGLADVMFTSPAHDLYLWTNRGGGSFKSTLIGNYPADWQLFGAGDVDGDGQDDLLWQNITTSQFAYWIMRDGVRHGSRIISVTAGYAPVSLGYYSPSGRISIVWASKAQDLYIWDSNGSAFFSSYVGPFGPYGPSEASLLAIGGGYAGAGMTLIQSKPVLASSGTLGYSQEIDRSFELTTAASSSSILPLTEGSVPVDWRSAGFLVEGRGINKTGLIYQYPNGRMDEWTERETSSRYAHQWRLSSI